MTSDTSKDGTDTNVSEPQNTYEQLSQAHERLRAESNERNKTAVCDALAKAGINFVTVSFDGYGDSGQIQDIHASNDDTPTSLPSDVVDSETIYWGDSSPKRSTCPFRDAIESLAFSYLEHTHIGWENDDGAYGEFTFDVANRTITLDYNERFTDSTYSHHTF